MERFKRNSYKFLFGMGILLISLFQGVNLVNALPTPVDRTQTKITEVKITDDKTQETELQCDDSFKLNIGWDSSEYGDNLKKDDYFKVKLPELMIFPNTLSTTKFDLLASDGVTVVAKAVLIPVSPSGGEVIVTFTDYVEGKSGVRGTMELVASFVKEKVIVDAKNTFEVSVVGANETKKLEVNIVGRPKLVDEVIAKSSSSGENIKEVIWDLRLNHSAKEQKNIIISDKLQFEDKDSKGMKLIENSFVLNKVTYDIYGNVSSTVSTKNVSENVKVNSEGTEFTYNMGTILAGEQYQLQYKSTYVSGEKLKNHVQFKSDTSAAEKESFFEGATSKGTGICGIGKIIISKSDADNNTIKLSGAIFKVINIDNGTSFTLTTGSDGEAVSDFLISGNYSIEEVTPPTGYERSIAKENVIIDAKTPIIKIIINSKKTLGKIEITKQDKNTLAKLAGAEFDIKNSDEKIIDHIVTDENGVARANNLSLGKYTIVETKAPTGYKLDGKLVAVEILASNQIIEIKIDNEKSETTVAKSVKKDSRQKRMTSIKKTFAKSVRKGNKSLLVKNKKSLPATGDNSQVILISAVLLLVASSGMLIKVKDNKKNKDNNK